MKLRWAFGFGVAASAAAAPLPAAVSSSSPRSRAAVSGLVASRLGGLGFQGGLGFADLVQPGFAAGQLRRELVTAAVLAERLVLGLIDRAQPRPTASDTSAARIFSFSLIRA